MNQKRPYTLRRRAGAAENTRLRILEATQNLLQHKGFFNISLDEIAAQAGVSRQTIYVQFGSKSHVLEAVAEAIERAGLENLMPNLLNADNPQQALRETIRRLMGFFHQYADVVRSLQAETLYDEEFGAAMRERKQQIWANTRRIVEWLQGQELLAADWTADDATDWLYTLTSFEFYDKLVTERQWGVEKCVDRIMQSIQLGLLRDTSRAND